MGIENLSRDYQLIRDVGADGWVHLKVFLRIKRIKCLTDSVKDLSRVCLC